MFNLKTKITSRYMLGRQRIAIGQNLNNKTYLARAWWAGFLVLMISIVMLSLCTFFRVENRELVEIWKCILFASLGYVIGIPTRVTSFPKTVNSSRMILYAQENVDCGQTLDSETSLDYPFL
jgi:lipopolysaccharide export LptBFGC system permease protein LptF